MSRALSLCNSFSNSYIRKNIRQIMLLRAKGNQEFFLDFFSQESKGDNITTDYTMGNRWLHGNEKSFLQTLFVWSLLRIAYVQRQHKPIKGWCNSGVTSRARHVYVRTWVIVVMTGKEINCYRTGMRMLWLGYTGTFLTWVVRSFLSLFALFAEEHIVGVWNLSLKMQNAGLHLWVYKFLSLKDDNV